MSLIADDQALANLAYASKLLWNTEGTLSREVEDSLTIYS